jgi:2-haloacid dehalogenase
MYKYLLWDIDGTVLDFLAAEAYAIRKLFEKYNLGGCTDEMIELYSKINIKYWQKLEKGELTKPEVLLGRFCEFFRQVGIDESIAEEFNSDYQLTLGDCIVFVGNAKEILLSQKDKFTIVAVTNGTKVAQEKKLKLSGLCDIFDAIFISENIGAEKPSKAFFDYVFENLGICDKSQVLIIGDSLTSDMKGGYLSGIDTCWYNPDRKQNTMDFAVTYEIDSLNQINEIVGI